jgi:DNA-binding NarL/FixJ family response regulator
MAIRVLLADDQELVRAGFAMILDAQRDIEIVGQAEDGERAITEAARLRPDVIVMDIQMPKVDGISATRAMLDAERDVPRVLVVTTFDADEYVYDALRAGASGFLLKNAPPEELVRAVRVVAEGDSLLSPEVTTRLIKAFCKQPARDWFGLRHSTSSPRVSARCSRSSRKGSPTRRSASVSWLATAPSRRTWHGFL